MSKSFFINLSVLKHNANYRLLYVGQSVSFAGTMITGVALPYQIYHQTQSTMMVGLLSLCQLIPLLFTALLGGVLADRHHRRRLLLLSEAGLAVGCLLLAINSYLTTPTIWLLFLVAPFMSALTGLHRPALNSITQQILAKEDFAMASALNSLTYSVGMIAGPAIGGLLIAHSGITITYLIDFASFVVSLGALLLMQSIPQLAAREDSSTWQALKEGIRYARARQELLGTYFVDFVAMIFGMPNALFPAVAQMHGGASTLGLLYAAPAVGATLISFVSGWTQRITRHGLAVAISASLWGIAIIGFGLANQFTLALICLAIAGACDTVSGIFRQVMWNDVIENRFRGRLAGIEMISYLSGPKLGDTEAGLVAAAFGVTTSIVSGGILCVLGVIVCCYSLPKFWRYRSTNTALSSTTEQHVS